MSGTRKISLGDSFGDIAVSVNGAFLRVRADGSVIVCSDGPVSLYTATRIGLTDGGPAAKKAGYKGHPPGYEIHAGIPILEGMRALILRI
jgi:hypothetical protein